MKNFLNLNQLSMSWNEKQKPQRFRRYAVMLMMLLTLGVGQMWASHGFFGDNACGVKVNYSGSTINEIKKNSSGASTEALGTISKLYLKEWWFAAWENTNDFSGSESGTMYYRIYPSGSASGSYTSSSRNYYNWGGWSGGSQNVWLGNNSLNVDLYGSKAPGNYIMEYYFMMGSSYLSNGSNNYKISFTVPGFTTTSKSHTFANTTVSSTKDETISFTQHYGTALTTSNCALTGTNKSEFEVRSISETGVTVRFKPSTAGTKSATLTITDAHSKTCTITLSGTTQYTVTYNKGDYGTGSNVTANKVYGTNLTLRNSGDFSRTGYNHTAWNTNSAGTGGTSYSLGGSYSSEAAVTLYPTWTPKTTSITIDLNGGSAGDESVTATYDSGLPSFTLATKTGGYNLTGYWTDDEDGDKIINSDGTLVRNTSYTSDEATPVWKSTSSSLKLYAQWNNFLSVTYDGNENTGGSAPTDATEYASGDEVTVASAPVGMVKTGYSFAGWNTAPGGGGTSYAAGATFNISANTTLYAQWTENKRNVTISVSPSGAGTLNKTSASVGVATTTTVTATAQPGYRFTGWSATNCSVASSSSASTTLSGNGTAGSGTLVANFARTYAYLEGRMTVYNAARSTETHVGSSKGKWSESSFNIAMDYDATNHRFYRHTYKTPAELSATQTDGTAQSQWFSIARSNASGSWSSKTTYHPSSNLDLTTTGSANKKAAQTSTTTYNYKFNSSNSNGYAIIYFDQSGVWYELEHTLNYNGNGSTSGSAPSQAYYNHGANATAASNPFSKTNYTFDGWNTEQYITGTSYAAGASVPMSTNTTLYAKWTRIITLNANGGGSGSTSVTATYNCATLPSITNPSKTGYTFGGWNTANDGSGDIVINTSGEFLPITGWCDSQKRFTRTASGATLYAKWTQTVTLNANTANHGSGDNTSATIVYKATAKTSITHCTPATGYHLVGYYTAATDGVKVLNADGSFASSAVTDYITNGKWTKAGATTLYAHYEANTYTIAFDPNDANYVGEATGTTASIAATYDVSYTLTTNGFSRAGYTFAGWATSPTGAKVYNDGQSVSNLTSTNAGTATLYAKWTPSTYTVSLNDMEGTCATKSMEVTMGSTYGAGTPALPEAAAVTPPAGYVFDGWYTATGGGTKVTSATQVTTAVDHTLYARYIQKAQVYFKNTLGWSKVYVVYDASWDGSQGTGSEGKIYREMTKVAGTSDVYYDNIPDEYITSWRWNIAFNNTYQYNYHAFTKGEAVFRYDFDKKATMFVPTSNTGTSADGNYTMNGVQYRSTGYADGSDSNPKYTSGYWRTYNNTYSGYTMTYQKNGAGSWSSGHKMESASGSSNVFIYTVHMDANSQYNFAFYKERDVNTKSVQFNYRTQITSTACTDLKLVCDPNNAWMWTTVEGDYVFKLEMKNDGHMYLTVEYPFKANDYKVVYSYTKDGAKTYDSEIIRGRANGLDTISVFIHSSSDASSRSLKIAQCTGINASGIPTWNNSYATIDISSVSESGVYDFIITQNGSAAATGAYWNKYTGNYYIRTESSDGGWDMYKYRPDNIMTLSEYSLTQTLSDPFSHYYCRFIGSTSVDITYAVATDYSPNISGTMTGDATIGGGATTLPATANVRFSWNEKTNALRRAYLKNAQGAGNNRYLVLHGADNKIRNNDATGTVITPSGDLVANELLFTDIGNWVYQVELKAIPGAKVSLIANYNSADRYLVGDGDTKWETIIGGTGSSLYSIKAVYDFKTNRLMTAWIPGGDITEDISDVDVLLLRYAQNAGTAITFGGDYTVGAKEVIGAIEMRYNDLVGHVAAWTSSSRPLLKFFVSFPFDVNVSDIFGLNSAYGDAYIVEEYDGAGRAEKGFFGGDGTTTFWKELQPGDVMLANVGYCVILDNDYFNGDIGNIWDNKSAGSSVYLYFPSASSVGDIESSSETISIPEHLCHHDRTFMTGGSREVNHINTDSHWNMMGVPIFDTHSDPGTSGQPGAVFATSGTDGDGNFNYFYEWNPSNNQFSIHTAVNYSFKCMHGYMVQYHGNVTFKTAAAPASVAARRAPQKENYQIELQVLNNNADVLNSAFVELRENACDTFELNEDVYMSFNNLAVNIYTLAGNYDVAANVLSVGNHTIPVGVKVTKAGTYTFSMPSNFSGTATLVDSFTGERTNLALDDYEVNLQRGVIEDRFLLEIDVQQVATAIDGASGEGSLKDGKAHKFLQNNTLYILQNGVLYDARGARVQ